MKHDTATGMNDTSNGNSTILTVVLNIFSWIFTLADIDHLLAISMSGLSTVYIGYQFWHKVKEKMQGVAEATEEKEENE